MKKSQGFSLVEVVLSLGIISFAIVAILGLFPVAMNSAKDSRQDTHSAFVVQSVLGQIKSLSASNATIQNGTNFSDTQSINLVTPASYYVIYDEYGLPVARGSAAIYTSGGGPASGVYQAEIAVVPEAAPNVGLSKVTINIGYPSTAPAVRRKTGTFVTYLRNTM